MESQKQLRNILVTVDVQNDFIDGSLAVNGGEQVVAPLNRVATAIRETGGQVIFTRDWHPSKTPHFNEWPAHCVAGTKGAAFSPNLTVQGSDTIIPKGTEQTDGYSGWEGATDGGATLEAIVTPLSPKERVNVYLGGLATDFCVKATTIDIAHHFADDERVSVYVLRDAVRGVNLTLSDDERAIEAMEAAHATVMTTPEAIAAIKGGAS